MRTRLYLVFCTLCISICGCTFPTPSVLKYNSTYLSSEGATEIIIDPPLEHFGFEIFWLEDDNIVLFDYGKNLERNNITARKVSMESRNIEFVDSKSSLSLLKQTSNINAIVDENFNFSQGSTANIHNAQIGSGNLVNMTYGIVGMAGSISYTNQRTVKLLNPLSNKEKQFWSFAYQSGAGLTCSVYDSLPSRHEKSVPVPCRHIYDLIYYSLLYAYNMKLSPDGRFVIINSALVDFKNKKSDILVTNNKGIISVGANRNWSKIAFLTKDKIRIVNILSLEILKGWND